MNNMDKMLKAASNKLGVDKSALGKAVESGSTEKLMSVLSSEQAESLKRILSDKATTKRIFESEQVQQLIKKLSEGK